MVKKVKKKQRRVEIGRERDGQVVGKDKGCKSGKMKGVERARRIAENKKGLRLVHRVLLELENRGRD